MICATSTGCCGNRDREAVSSLNLISEKNWGTISPFWFLITTTRSCGSWRRGSACRSCRKAFFRIRTLATISQCWTCRRISPDDFPSSCGAVSSKRTTCGCGGKFSPFGVRASRYNSQIPFKGVLSWLKTTMKSLFPNFPPIPKIT